MEDVRTDQTNTTNVMPSVVVVDNGTSPEIGFVLTGYLSDGDYNVIIFALGMTGFMVSFARLVTNSVNVFAFKKIGFRDGVSVCFIGLASADLIRSMTNMILFFSRAMQCAEIWHPDKHIFIVSPFSMVTFASSASKMLYMVTTLNVTFISLVRCLSIVFPIQFLTLLSPLTATVVNVVFYVSAFCLFLPTFILFIYRTEPSEDLNGPRYTLRTTDEREIAKYYIELISESILPFSTLVVLVCCVFIMGRALMGVSKFRNSGGASQTVKSASGEGSKSKLSGKELQAVLQVTSICVAYIVFNTPMVTMRLAVTFIPGLGGRFDTNRFYREYFVASLSRRILEQMNANINVFIYFRFNSKVREVLKAVTCPCVRGQRQNNAG